MNPRKETPLGLEMRNQSRAELSNSGLMPAPWNQSPLMIFGKLAAQETVVIATSVLGMLLLIAGLVFLVLLIARAFKA